MYQRTLFKYIPFNSPELGDSSSVQGKRKNDFEKGEIWYPRADKLNDPFECSPYFQNFDYNEEQIEEAVESLSDSELNSIESVIGKYKKNDLIKILKTPNVFNHNSFERVTDIGKNLVVENVYKYIHQIIFVEYFKLNFSNSLLKTGVLSMTGDPFNLLMWAHYGGNSSGICIEFERNPENILGKRSTRRVKYVKNRPTIKFQKRKNYAKQIIYTKSNIWRYEKEWRTCQPEGDKSYPFPGKVLRILFGLNCNEKTIELTKKIFGKNVVYENIIIGDDFSIQSDNGIHHSISQVELSW
ncbi:hypothetical protein DSCA_53130 [Desulfosarcina alkanivorans]|uniref:DUF2971 domain-containing protein n=1 Tax=Desulfosarcina alkanivorans TaxID=571177 RepID=A0A5K7YTK2_9BACT|nr:DUF2971 domain-containing protein [Desulfosarcina alkanivorans]BBO71383.1 hypothetical protein DSCA_53130 [Desulfosarcina alkanivorans]